MQASDVMTRDVVTVSPDDTVQAVAKLMVEHGISGVPVVEGGGRLVGIVTEGDLLLRVENDTDRRRSLWRQIFTAPAELAAEFHKATGRRVRDVMTRDVASVTEATSLADIADLIEERGIRRVPVVREGILTGLVSRRDLVRTLMTGGRYRDGDLMVVDYQ